ncbi:MAG: arylesterase [Deltaproteobacteria bacterium]|nr:arylesterase [Deltaproteobacteria bacterium]
MRGTAWLARPGRGLLLLLAAALLPAWGGCERPPEQNSQPPERQTGQERTGGADRPVIIALGDSLTAGFGLPVEDSYPSLLQEKLAAEGHRHLVVNAGVSGDTTAGGLSRMDWLLRQRADIMIVALGANDGLRGLSPPAMAENLAGIIEKARQNGIRVLLAGMRMPANYGADYQQRFAEVFPALAEKYGLPFLPFLLDGVAGEPGLNQPDGIHPNARGTRLVMENVWQVLRTMLAE